MKIAVLIPIKLNNQRLPGKNTRILGSHPLMYYQQSELLKIKDKFDSINIYCSDESVRKYILPGINFVKRPTALDGNLIKGNEIYKEFINTIDADYYLLDHVTAPFVHAHTILKMINAIESGMYDSAFAAYKIQKFLWQDGKPLNFNVEDLPRTQDLKPVYVDQCGPYLFSKRLFLDHSRRIGFKPYIQEMSFCEQIDIDTYDDFELAEKYVDNVITNPTENTCLC